MKVLFIFFVWVEGTAWAADRDNFWPSFFIPFIIVLRSLYFLSESAKELITHFSKSERETVVRSEGIALRPLFALFIAIFGSYFPLNDRHKGCEWTEAGP